MSSELIVPSQKLLENPTPVNLELVKLTFHNMLQELEVANCLVIGTFLREPKDKTYGKVIRTIFNPYDTINPNANGFKQQVQLHLLPHAVNTNFTEIQAYLPMYDPEGASELDLLLQKDHKLIETTGGLIAELGACIARIEGLSLLESPRRVNSYRERQESGARQVPTYRDLEKYDSQF